MPVMPPPHAPQEPVRVSGHPRVFGAAHRSIFLAGGGVVGHNIPMRHAGKGPPTPAASAGGNNKAALEHYIRSGKQVEAVLGARPSPSSLASLRCGFEYLVKWRKQSHVHCTWIEEDLLDQLAPAALGEYLLQHGRRPLMLMDQNWTRPQRVVAVHQRVGGGGGGGGSNGGSGGGVPDAGPGRGGQGAALAPGRPGSATDSDSRRVPSPDGPPSGPGSDGVGYNGCDGSGGTGGEPGGGTNSGSGGSDSGSDPKTRVLVKWWGLPYDACTWEHVEVHPDLPDMLHRFREWSANSLAASKDLTENGSTAAARAIAAAKKHNQKRAGSGFGGSGSGSGFGEGSGGGSGDGSGKGSAQGVNSGSGEGSDGGEGDGAKKDSGSGSGNKDGSSGSDTDDKGVGEKTSDRGSGDNREPMDLDSGHGKTGQNGPPDGELDVAVANKRRRHRHGTTASSADPAVRWLIAAWMHREGVVMTIPAAPFEPHSLLANLTGAAREDVDRPGMLARRRAAAIGMLAAQHTDFGARNAPALVIVPAVVISEWTADFQRYAPELNVVEYCGSAVSRQVVQEHEWSHRRAVRLRRPSFNKGSIGKTKEMTPASASGGSGEGGNGNSGSGDATNTAQMTAQGGRARELRVLGSGSGSGSVTTPPPAPAQAARGDPAAGTAATAPRSPPGAEAAASSEASLTEPREEAGPVVSARAAATETPRRAAPVTARATARATDRVTRPKTANEPARVPETTRTSWWTEGSGGGGSGGGGSDPSSTAAAAAAAVAAARRPKFHVLIASHDAASQDLLLLRQVAWETLILVEDVDSHRSVTMSMLPRVGTLQSANRVLMLNGPIPRTIGETLTIMDFIKQSPEGMMALERHLLGLEDAMALQEATSILEQVTLDLTLVLKREPKHAPEEAKHAPDAAEVPPRLAGFDVRAGAAANLGSNVQPMVRGINVPPFIAATTPSGHAAAHGLKRQGSGVEDARPTKRPGVSHAPPNAPPPVGVNVNVGFPNPLAGFAGLNIPAGFPPAVPEAQARNVSNEGIQRAAQVASAAAAQAAAAGAPPQMQIIQALMTTMHQDPAAATAMIQRMQQMMLPVAAHHGVSPQQLAHAQGALLQQMFHNATQVGAGSAAMPSNPFAAFPETPPAAGLAQNPMAAAMAAAVAAAAAATTAHRAPPPAAEPPAQQGARKPAEAEEEPPKIVATKGKRTRAAARGSAVKKGKKPSKESKSTSPDRSDDGIGGGGSGEDGSGSGGRGGRGASNSGGSGGSGGGSGQGPGGSGGSGGSGARVGARRRARRRVSADRERSYSLGRDPPCSTILYTGSRVVRVLARRPTVPLLQHRIIYFSCTSYFHTYARVDTWLPRAHRSLLGVSPTAAFAFSLLVRFAGVCLAPPEAPLFVFPFLGTVTPATTESAATSSSASSSASESSVARAFLRASSTRLLTSASIDVLISSLGSTVKSLKYAPVMGDFHLASRRPPLDPSPPLSFLLLRIHRAIFLRSYVNPSRALTGSRSRQCPMGHIQSCLSSTMSSSSGRRVCSYLASPSAILNPSTSLSNSWGCKSAADPWCTRDSSEMVSMPPGWMGLAGAALGLAALGAAGAPR